jgi:uncharacterized protein YecE (DUF72 family)
MTRRDAQIDLFGGAAPTGSEAGGPTAARAPGDGGRGPVPVEAIAATDGLRALAASLPRALHLGTSSWAFPGWAGLVYAREERPDRLARHGLAAYARHPLLRAVGLDRTFYQPIAREAFAAYAAAVPTDFRFLVKAHAAVTTPGGLARLRVAGARDVFLDAAYAARAVVEPAVLGLGDRLGVLLFQFPPLPRQRRLVDDFPRRLRAFLGQLPRGVPYAVEVRTAALLDDAHRAAYADALAEGGATHGFTVHPSMPPLPEQAARLDQAAWAYGPVVVRWMLQRDQGYEQAREAWAPFHEFAAPDPLARVEVATLVQALLSAPRPVLAIVNNKAEGSAPRSVQELARRLASPPGEL